VVVTFRAKLELWLSSLCIVLSWFTPHANAQSYLFNRADFVIGTNPSGVAVGDFNHDGMLDVATTDSIANTVSVLLGKADGTFSTRITQLTFSAGSPTVGDFNRDGKLDLAIIGSEGVSILLGKGNGTFQAPMNFSVDPNSGGFMVVGDFNHDGKLDVAVAGSTISVLLGNGDGTLKPYVGYSIPGYGIGIVTADFNRDGHLDLAVGDYENNTVDVLLGKGDGTFGAATSFAAGQWPTQLGTL
jgi:hypothetical protein